MVLFYFGEFTKMPHIRDLFPLFVQFFMCAKGNKIGVELLPFFHFFIDCAVIIVEVIFCGTSVQPVQNITQKQ